MALMRYGMGMRTMYPDVTGFFVSTGPRKAIEWVPG